VTVVDLTCNQCQEKAFIVFGGQSWCRNHFLGEAAQRDEQRAPAAAAGDQGNWNQRY
jgi:hypothetical protein